MNKYSLLIIIFSLNLYTSFAQTPDANGIVYVKKGGVGTGIGDSWNNAIGELADALKAAKTNTAIKQIWVAAGTYKPMYSPADNNFGNNDGRKNAFLLVNNVPLYGGFAGGETQLSQRNSAANPTILSGDFNDDDQISGSGASLSITGNSENAIHVVITVSTVLLDGFTVTGGNANNNNIYVVNSKSIMGLVGGGMFNISTNSTITNCSFKGNRANSGGGMYNVNSNSIITNCSFMGNSAGNGGAMCIVNSSPTINNCTVSNNKVSLSGGGIYNDNSTTTINNCIISNNTSDNMGGGVSNYGYSVSTISNCLFVNNSAPLTSGGAIVNTNSASSNIVNCTFSGNTANGGNAGAIYSTSSSNTSTIANSICWGNGGSQQIQYTVRVINISYSVVQGATVYPGVGNINTNPLFINASGSNYSLLSTSPCIDAGNNAALPAGITTDLAGNKRIYGSSIDMGTFEVQPLPDASGIIYVKKGGAGTRIGNSWANAIGELADALKEAKTNTAIKQIWVAAGIYKPMYSPDDNNFGNNAGRSNAFLLMSNVPVYGGFAGGETQLGQRNSTANPTILSGDFNDDDQVSGSGASLNITGNSENTYHVVISVSAALLDGFTVTGGNANNNNSLVTINNKSVLEFYGGGMYNVGSNATITNCSFTGNNAINGGGMYNNGSSPTLTDCSFTGNIANNGGAIHNSNSSNPSITHCTFSSNKGRYGGGGIYNHNSLSTINNCTFSSNTSDSYGGGIFHYGNSVSTISNCLFVKNTAPLSSGGAIGNTNSSSFIAVNCTFSGNTANGGNPGAIYSTSTSTSTIANSVCWGNGGSQQIQYTAGAINVSYSVVQGSTVYPGVNNINTDPLFINASSGNYSLLTTSPCINVGNNAALPAGITTDLEGNPRIVNNTIDMGAFEIQQVAQTITFNSPLTATYGDADMILVATASSGLTVNYSSTDITVAEPYQDAADNNKWKIKIKKAGSVTITASQPGDAVYQPANMQQAFTITPKNITITAETINKIYGDVDPALSYTITTGALVTGDVLNGVLARMSGEAVATYPIIQGTLTSANNPNYLISFNESDLTITPKSLIITANNQTKAYDGTAYSGGNGVSYNGFAFGEDDTVLSSTLLYGGSSQGAVNTGNYSITLSGLTSSNYSIQYEAGNLLISTSLSNTLGFNTQTPGATLTTIYGSSDMNGSAVATSGLAAEYTSSNTNVVTISSNGQVHITGVGISVIKASQAGNSNYAPAADISFTIRVSPAPLTITANNQTKTYDGNGYSGGNGVTYSGFVAGEDPTMLGGVLAYTGSAQGAVNTGTYSIMPGGLAAANYTINYLGGILNIVPSGNNEITFNSQITGTAVNTTYGQGNIDGSAIASAGLPVTYASSNSVVAAVNAAGLISIKGAGTAVITASQNGDDNHAAATPVVFQLNVAKQPLTITANNDSKIYDSKTYNGGNGVSFTGFVNGENATNLSGSLTYSGNAQNALHTGSYFITPGGYSAANYAITYKDGSLTITKATLHLSANAQTKVYGTADPDLTYTATGFAGGDNASLLTGNLTRTAGEHTGSYAITQGTISVSNDYTINYTPGNLTITKATLHLSANAQTKVYGTTDPNLTYTATGFVNGDNASVVTGSLSRDAGENADTYDIQQNTLAAGDNYSISFNSNNLTINKATLRIIANAQSKTYGDVDPSLTYTATGLVGTDTISGILSRTAGQSAGIYFIDLNNVSAGSNYTIDYVGAHFTITKAMLSVTAGNSVMCLNNKLPSFVVTYSGFKYNDDATSLTTSPTITIAPPGTAGNYALVPSGGVAANYTFSYATGMLTVNPLPIVTANTSVVAVCSGSTVFLTGGGANGYVWSNDVINNQSFTPPSTNTYHVTGTDSKSCSNTASVTVTVYQVPTGNIIQSALAAGSTAGYQLTAPAGNTYQWNTGETGNTILAKATGVYEVTVTNQQGCNTLFSTTVNMGSTISIPNTFSPNGDGINDYWTIPELKNYPGSTVIIVNRDGQTVFESKNFSRWEGRYNGKDLPAGVYFYLVNLPIGGPSGRYKGWVNLVK